MKRLAIITAIVFVLAFGASYVIGVPDFAQGTAGATGQYSTAAANAVQAEGGNVTQVDVSTIMSTQKWQGFWGNISGSLALGDGVDIFYNWTVVSFQAVYASPGNDIDWATAGDLSGQAAREGKDTDYGFASGDSDSINATFGGGACSAGTIFAAADGVSSFNSTGGASAWETCLGEDAGAALDDTVFGADIVWAGSDSFKGSSVQYQLMVPVIAAEDSYYFYLEI